MNIRDVQTGIHRLDSYRNGSVGEAARTDAGAATQSARDTSSTGSDRVELSSAARTDRAPSVQELAFARKAMLGIPPLSDERASDILMRIQEGFYSQPEVLKKIAEKFTEELAGAL